MFLRRVLDSSIFGISQLVLGAKLTLAKVIESLKNKSITPTPRPRDLKTVCKAIGSLGHTDIIPSQYIEQLPLQVLWESEDFKEAPLSALLGQEIYERYRKGGTIEDLLASYLFAGQTLELFENGGGNGLDAPIDGEDSARGSTEAEVGGTPESCGDPTHGVDKVTAAIAYADRAACIFEWNKTTQNYLLALFSAVGAVNMASKSEPRAKALALDVLGNVYELKWQKDHILGDLTDSINASKAATECANRDQEFWPMIVSNYANHLELRYAIAKKEADIETAISLSQDAYDLAKNDFERARGAVNLATKFNLRVKMSSDKDEKLANLNRVVGFMEMAIRLTPANLPERWSRLQGMSTALAARAQITHSDQDYGGAISYARDALGAVPPLSPVREILLRHLADVLEVHYKQGGQPSERNLDEINESIRWTRETMVMYQTVDHSAYSAHRISAWNELVGLLGQRLYLKHDQTQDPSDREAAAMLGELMLDQDGLPFGPGTVLQMGVPDELGTTITSSREAVDQCAADPTSLGSSEGETPGRGAEDEDENETFDPLRVYIRSGRDDGSQFRDTAAAEVPSNADFFYWLDNPSPTKQSQIFIARWYRAPPNLAFRMARILSERGFQRYYKALDLVFESGKNMRGEDEVQRCKWCAEETRRLVKQLASSIHTAEDIAAVKAWIEACTDESRAPLMQMLASQMGLYLGDNVLDLTMDLIIQALKKALDLSLPNPARHAQYLGDLAKAYQARFRQRGRPEDFSTALEYAQDAMRTAYHSSALKPQPKVALPLADLLKDKYRMAGSFDDLQMAVKLAAETVLLLDSADDARAEALLLLGVLLHERSNRTKSLLDLEESLIFAKTALSANCLSRGILVALLNLIMAVLGTRCRRMERDGDFGRKILAGKIIYYIAPFRDPVLPISLHNLSVALRQNFEKLRDKTSSAEDIDEAVSAELLALELSDTRGPQRGMYLRSLGFAYRARFEAFAKEEDQTYALQAFLKASEDISRGNINLRITALQEAAKIQVARNEYVRAVDSLDRAIELFANLSPHGMSQVDKQALLSDVSGLPSDAAAVAVLASGMRDPGPKHAIELLERGRGLIIGAVIDERSEATQLMSIDPELHRQFIELQYELVSPRPTRHVILSYHREDVSPAAEDPHLRMERLLQQVRKIKGLRHFLRIPSDEELQQLAKDGTIIILFNSIMCQRAFAIIVAERGVTALELPRLTVKDIEDNILTMVRIRNDKSKNHFKKGKKMLPVLKWLWQTAVKPVIESIGYTKTEGPTSEIELPRVWWIGVGLLAHFPFHAAGCYEKGQVECAMDIINSTYVPTIKSLLYAKQKDIILPNSPSAKTCFVTMENTPEHDSLEGVEEEAEHIRRILPEGNSTVLHQPTATAVLTEIGQCNNLHLACHGKSDLSDPSKSYLTLVRTNPDERRTRRPDKLFVGDIMRKSTNGSGIAFLRACYSADNPAHGLSDEVIHLASAFQLAGFSHVLGTLWSTRNGSCGEVSEKFYKYLLEGEQEPGHKQVALAFHRAVNDLRLDNLSNPLLWASFVHIGA